MRISLFTAALLVLALVLGQARFAPAAGKDSSRLGSVGLQVVPTATGELVVLQVPAGTPAAASGIRPGDLIIKIGDLSLSGSNFADVVAKHLWGPEGSRVVIQFLRPGEAGRHTVTLQRGAADPRLTMSPAARNGSADKGVKQ